MRGDAVRLLAQRVRAAGVDPARIRITSVSMTNDRAQAAWSAQSLGGNLHLVRYLDRWWEADAAGALYPLQGLTRGIPIDPRGAVVTLPQQSASGYAVQFAYAANDAPANATFSLLYVRTPAQAEMLPSPTPPHDWGGANAVFFFNFSIAASHPVHFTAGTRLNVWFPFVLDDQLPYLFSAASPRQSMPAVTAKPFDNALQFALPAFTVQPDEELMGEIDGAF